MFERKTLFHKFFISFQIMGATKRCKYKTLNLNISASWQNIKNLISNFGDIHVSIMHVNFQVSSFTGVGGE